MVSYLGMGRSTDGHDEPWGQCKSRFTHDAMRTRRRNVREVHPVLRLWNRSVQPRTKDGTWGGERMRRSKYCRKKPARIASGCFESLLPVDPATNLIPCHQFRRCREFVGDLR